MNIPDFYRALVADYGFIDTYRYLHPDTVEHSWVGRTGDGYRYDHAFCSAALGATIADCRYVHQPREDRLSDHSALTARLNLPFSSALQVSDPAAATTPATLF
jgi:exodeoxyribonuclease III